MTDKALKKISRGELLDLLIYQTEQNKRLRDELESAQKELKRREIAINQSGTLAEASARISEIFEAADRTAQLYLENIEKRSREMDEECSRKIEAAAEEPESRGN